MTAGPIGQASSTGHAMSTVISASQSRESSTETVTERVFALGLGLTNECNLACSFCYRDPTRLDRLSLEQVRAILNRLPVRSVNLGTGENGMHPNFAALVHYLRSEPIKLTITSNGYSIETLDDAEVTAFQDIEFSLDYPTEAEQDRQRGPGNWCLIHEQAARCRKLGVSATFIAVMMRSNFDRLADIAEIVKAYDAPLRINVYQPVRSDAFVLTYDEYWRGFEALFARTDAIAIGEPLVRAMAGLPARRGGCGVATVRVTPRATVQPCVYWPGAARRLIFCSTSALTSPRPNRLPRHDACRRPAGTAGMLGPAAEGVLGAGGCCARLMNPIPIARSFAVATASSRCGWRPAASCLSSKALAPRS